MSRYSVGAVEIRTEIFPACRWKYLGDDDSGPHTEYKAYVLGNSGIWEMGRTEEEAIGKLIVSLDVIKNGSRNPETQGAE